MVFLVDKKYNKIACDNVHAIAFENNVAEVDVNT